LGLDPDLRSALEDFVESKVAPRTRVEYRIALRDFLQATGIRTLGEALAVKSSLVVRYRNSLQDRGLSPSTINLRLAAVRGLFRRMLREGRIAANPADPELVEGLPVSDESRTQGLTLDEVKRILGACDGTLRGLRDRALLTTLFYEGLRRSEASRLRYRDITTKRGLLEVRNSKNNPYAVIRLRPEVKRAIDDYLEVLNRELQKLETRPEDPVFCSLSRLRSFGRRLSPSAINDIVKDRVKAAGITDKRITAHSWRHTSCTLALAAGVPLQQVQRHLRHKKIETTLRYDREREVRKNPTLDLMPGVDSA
jgi:site-specific recombinase XerD